MNEKGWQVDVVTRYDTPMFFFCSAQAKTYLGIGNVFGNCNFKVPITKESRIYGKY